MLKRNSHHFFLLALSLAGLTGGANACSYYAKLNADANIWGLPEAGTSPVLATAPANARVCIRREMQGEAGGKWGRVGFYLDDSIRYNVAGWIDTAQLNRSGLAATPAAKPTDVTPAAAQRQKPDRSNEIERLKAQNTELQNQLKRLKDSLVEDDRSEQPVSPAATSAPKDKAESMTKSSANSSSWQLNVGKSAVRFAAMKAGATKPEDAFAFEKLQGAISGSGATRIDIALNRIRSGDAIRDVRLSHLLFASERFPKASILANLDADQLTGLPSKGATTRMMNFRLKLHEREKQFQTKVTLTRQQDGMIRVAFIKPVMVDPDDFALMPGMKKMMQVEGRKSMPEMLALHLDLLFETTQQG